MAGRGTRRRACSRVALRDQPGRAGGRSPSAPWPVRRGAIPPGGDNATPLQEAHREHAGPCAPPPSTSPAAAPLQFVAAVWRHATLIPSGMRFLSTSRAAAMTSFLGGCRCLQLHAAVAPVGAAALPSPKAGDGAACAGALNPLTLWRPRPRRLRVAQGRFSPVVCSPGAGKPCSTALGATCGGARHNRLS
ncbi:MAG: hypothetical protein J3K34DRAFT_267559 [Monoraphidium minutum]|nr:MAG: hypothetical protein J3K34DRAFT_267559 [Monoraphidium minutum]